MYLLITRFCFVLCLFYKVNCVMTDIGPDHGKVAACYWTTWSAHRPGRGKFLLEDVNPTLCTHLIFAFTLLDDTDDSMKVLGKWPDLELDEEKRNNVTKFKNKYPHLKVMVAIGGWQDGSIKYSKMAASLEKRRNFINNTIKFIKQHDFDGLDLIWQYPAKRGGSLHDKANFLQLVKDLRGEYDKHNLLLTAALGGSKDTIDNGYDVSELSLYLDYMFMMCYDYGGWWSRTTGPAAPLHGPDLLNVEYTINYMLKLGADPKKLILGVSFYGRTYIRLEVVDGNNNTAPPRLGENFNKESTFNGSYTQEEGFMGYNEICLQLLDRNWIVYWDEKSKTPFAVNGQKLIAYDNDRSISEKVKFALNNSLGGVMVWSIDTDDFRGDCYQDVNGRKDYPLLRTVDREIREYLKHEGERPVKIKKHPRVSQVQSGTTCVFRLNYFLFLVTFLTLHISKVFIC